MQCLGAKGPVAILGYMFDGDWAEHNPSLLERFWSGMHAKEILAPSEAEWTRLAPSFGIDEPDALSVYRQRYSEGMLRRSLTEEEADARTLYRVLAAIGGAAAGRSCVRAASGHFYRASIGVERLGLEACLACAADRGLVPRLATCRRSPASGSAGGRDGHAHEARSGALAFNLGVTLARVAVAFASR